MPGVMDRVGAGPGGNSSIAGSHAGFSLTMPALMRSLKDRASATALCRRGIVGLLSSRRRRFAAAYS